MLLHDIDFPNATWESIFIIEMRNFPNLSTLRSSVQLCASLYQLLCKISGHIIVGSSIFPVVLGYLDHWKTFHFLLYEYVPLLLSRIAFPAAQTDPFYKSNSSECISLNLMIFFQIMFLRHRISAKTRTVDIMHYFPSYTLSTVMFFFDRNKIQPHVLLI